jgi:hypothetical protein
MWGGEESVGAKFESGPESGEQAFKTDKQKMLICYYSVQCQDVLPHSTILTDAELSSRTDK